MIVISAARPVRGLVVAALGASALALPAGAHAAAGVPCTAPVTTTGSVPGDTGSKIPVGSTGRPDATCGDAAQKTVDGTLASVQDDVKGFEAKVKSEWGRLCVLAGLGAQELKNHLAAIGLGPDDRALDQQPKSEQDRLDLVIRYVTTTQCPAPATPERNPAPRPVTD
ncbi:hypothetical protein [Sphaerisporangium fuscum]|uniref:hypothetical protein n=1 Tax=Sphaerisporangium fuscum TaxID=2835868 RepID=UPI001BDCE95D|nr:hypothetical protein [Sphaerisporangium fuscum]